MFWFFWIKLKEQEKIFKVKQVVYFERCFLIRIFLFGLLGASLWVRYMSLIFGDAFGPGFFGLAVARLPSANQALCIPIADYKTQLSLEIGIDSFGVKKHVAS